MIAALLHIWFLGVMPLIALMGTLFDESASVLKEYMSANVFAVLLWCGIVAIFLIIGYSFLIGELYISNTISRYGYARGAYLMMVLSPFVYFMLVHLLFPESFFSDAVEAGIVAFISQHASLHSVRIVSLFRSKRVAMPRVLWRITLAFLFIVISVVLCVLFFLEERSWLWRGLFSLSLLSSLAGALRFYWKRRFEIDRVHENI